jgi:hypothetical protein
VPLPSAGLERQVEHAGTPYVRLLLNLGSGGLAAVGDGRLGAFLRLALRVAGTATRSRSPIVLDASAFASMRRRLVVPVSSLDRFDADDD